MFDMNYITQYLRLYRYFLSSSIGLNANVDSTIIYKKYYGNSYYSYETDKEIRDMDFGNIILADYIFKF